MQTKPRFRDACSHGIERFISTINNKDIYDLAGIYGKSDGFCVRYGNHKRQCYDTKGNSFSQLIQNIYGDDE